MDKLSLNPSSAQLLDLICPNQYNLTQFKSVTATDSESNKASFNAA